MADNILLTGTLETIAALAGEAAALKLSAEKGGTIVYIPQPGFLKPGHWLVDLVGFDEARAIAEGLGPSHLDIPLGPFGGQRHRIADAIRKGIQEGLSIDRTARLVGVSRRTVTRHRRGTADDSDQGDLFGDSNG